MEYGNLIKRSIEDLDKQIALLRADYEKYKQDPERAEAICQKITAADNQRRCYLDLIQRDDAVRET